MDIINIVILSLSGLLLTFVGSMRLFNPIQTYAKNSGIELPNEVNLLNEMRGVSGVMLSGGLLAFLGIFLPELTRSSFVVLCVIYLGFAIGRTLSFNLDGKANQQIG